MSLTALPWPKKVRSNLLSLYTSQSYNMKYSASQRENKVWHDRRRRYRVHNFEWAGFENDTTIYTCATSNYIQCKCKYCENLLNTCSSLWPHQATTYSLPIPKFSQQWKHYIKGAWREHRFSVNSARLYTYYTVFPSSHVRVFIYLQSWWTRH